MISLIQHFEADFQWKVSLKILNSGTILKTFTHDKVSCSKTQHNEFGKVQTRDHMNWSQALCHWATALLYSYMYSTCVGSTAKKYKFQLVQMYNMDQPKSGSVLIHYLMNHNLMFQTRKLSQCMAKPLKWLAKPRRLRPARASNHPHEVNTDSLSTHWVYSRDSDLTEHWLFTTGITFVEHWHLNKYEP